MSVLLGAALVASCAQPQVPSRELHLSRNGLTIVSMNPCTDSILLEVAEPEQVLAISHYSHDPRSSSVPVKKARRFAPTGGTVEEILALDPDIVIAGSFMAPASLQALNALEYRVVLFDSPRELEGSYAQIREIGALVGHEDRAEELIARIEQSLAKNAPETGHSPIAATLWQPGQIVPGKSTLVSELLKRTGFASHSQSRGLGQGDYLPLEQVLADPPELLLVAGETPAQRHSVLAQLDGTQVESFDPVLLYCGGPTIIGVAERLAEIRESLK